MLNNITELLLLSFNTAVASLFMLCDMTNKLV